MACSPTPRCFMYPARVAARVAGIAPTLKPRGVVFTSNPHGYNEEGWNRGCYDAYHAKPLRYLYRKSMRDLGGHIIVRSLTSSF
jgi:hypothetical protein